jgi:hypothetical protein
METTISAGNTRMDDGALLPILPRRALTPRILADSVAHLAGARAQEMPIRFLIATFRGRTERTQRSNPEATCARPESRRRDLTQGFFALGLSYKATRRLAANASRVGNEDASTVLRSGG